jgi:hypothetical protein
MEPLLKQSIWQQFGAAIDMFAYAVSNCPEHLWTETLWQDEDDARYGQVWYIAYHTLSWLDLYLGGSYEDFVPPAPFVRGKLPDNPYTKDEIIAYLKQCRQKCQTVIEGLTDEQAYRICTFKWMEPTFLELQLYSMRHVQEHAAQLNLMLGQHGLEACDWVSKAEA